jgi:hypothetical protein
LRSRVDFGVKEGEDAAAPVAEDELTSLLAIDDEDIAALFVAPLDRDSIPAQDLLQERGRGYAGRAANPLDDERHLVDVAPTPLFPRFQRTDDRVRRRVGVCRGVSVR